jgi:hypothetical protein
MASSEAAGEGGCGRGPGRRGEGGNLKGRRARGEAEGENLGGNLKARGRRGEGGQAERGEGGRGGGAGDSDSATGPAGRGEGGCTQAGGTAVPRKPDPGGPGPRGFAALSDREVPCIGNFLEPQTQVGYGTWLVPQQRGLGEGGPGWTRTVPVT